VAVNPGGRGRRFQLLEITEDGRSLLKTYGVALPRGHGRGGLAHQWWCQTIRDWLAGVGIPTAIEDDRHGVRVDLVAGNGDGRELAIEVETSPGHELENIRKDVAAGFQTVVSLLNDQPAVRRVRASLEKDPEVTNGAGIYTGVVADYARILGTLVQHSS
jgi:hypothetical protein